MIREIDSAARADVIVLGCVKTNGPTPAKAKDLYISALWSKRRRHAEALDRPWYIYSADHGIIDPELLIAPYDVAMSGLPRHQVRAKGIQAAAQLEALFGPLRGKVIEIHAGASYVRSLAEPLAKRGATLRNPLGRLKFGPQLHWYDEMAGVSKSTTADLRHETTRARPTATPPHPDLASLTDAELIVERVFELEPFVFRWPEGDEQFERGWDYAATIGPTSFHVRHGIGGREVYGRYRVHTVTWLDGQPMVEGVASDDYDESGALLSTLRIGGKAHVRELTDLPMGYAGFTIVRQSDEITAKYSRQSLAIKVLADDLGAWARHAVLRAQSKDPGGGVGWAYRRVAPSERSLPATLPPPPDLDRQAIVDAFLYFGAREKAELNKTGEPFFTPNELANRFLIQNPFAFLLAVIFDQGIVAERAWAAPYELRHRLGHLDPYRLGDEESAIAKAIATPPMLKRFVNTIPSWIASAARRVVRDFGGDAGRIWGDNPTAEELERRLLAFDGIGQKKAAMAVEMLERDLHVPIRALHGTDIAYDVHVRRVFLRTGLADRDDRDHMVEQGRRLNPARPGAIDFPMWLVGRRWCRPGVPLCPDCPLFGVCPRLVERAGGVKGA